MTTTQALDLSDLADDGDTIELDDGRTLRLRIEPDYDTSLDDYDCYGRTAPVESDRWSGRHLPRPAGFNGRARKLQVGRGDWVWWQPHDEDPPETDDERARDIRDLIERGFCGAIVEVLDGTDAYGRPIVINVASLWGIDSLADGYLTEVVNELVAEVLS